MFLVAFGKYSFEYSLFQIIKIIGRQNLIEVSIHWLVIIMYLNLGKLLKFMRFHQMYCPDSRNAGRTIFTLNSPLAIHSPPPHKGEQRKKVERRVSIHICLRSSDQGKD